MPNMPPHSSQSTQRSQSEQLGMGEALNSRTIISFPVLFPVSRSCQKGLLMGNFHRAKGGNQEGELSLCGREGGREKCSYVNRTEGTLDLHVGIMSWVG